MNEKYTEHNEMTNAEFLEEIKEITGIFIRAIAKGYPNFENREDFENEIKKRGY